MVAHKVHHILHGDSMVGFNPKRKTVLKVFTAGIVLILGHFSGIATIESCPDAGITEAGTLKINRVVGVAETELGIGGVLGIETS